jgi:S1-C subfamily serine protease
MSGVKKANGHRVNGAIPLVGRQPVAGPHPSAGLVGFDVDATLAAVRPLRASIPPDGFTAATLGTEREGSAVLIDAEGLLLTIGYLVVEATEITVGEEDGHRVGAHVVGYDHETGFGLIRAERPLSAQPLELARDTSSLAKDMPVVLVAHGGINQAVIGRVVARRPFAGSWEYMLDSAIFTVPLHPHWSGAALVGKDDGLLYGIGSLFVQEAAGEGATVPGNMFVPVDLYDAIADDMRTLGRPAKTPRPWLGMHTTEALGHLLVAGVQDGGPADEAGVRPGDVVLRVEGEPVRTLEQMYCLIWSSGGAGTEIRLDLVRGSESVGVLVRSSDRHRFLRQPMRH